MDGQSIDAKWRLLSKPGCKKGAPESHERRQKSDRMQLCKALDWRACSSRDLLNTLVAITTQKLFRAS